MMMNKPSKEVLNVFGKILYSLAMADGEIQDSELAVLKKIVSKNEWAKEIEFSFTEAMELNMDPHISFLKNMRVFRSKEMDEHIPFFIELMEKIAESHNGIFPAELSMIQEFKSYCHKDAIDYEEHQLKSEEHLQIQVI
ncbi:hypothetical protein [Reichenbachiella versicolor]|uniref:hypothetical protein n=1 Tax=Reichenbachiella versicolor TaxID=1821036 RepID=UPI000D6E6C2B|nr:hypothetical protein [Reichenbachiella versicolor]